MARDDATGLDRELADLPADLRWREWMRRIEAVLFASSTPVTRNELARVVGRDVAVELLVADLIADLDRRPYQVARIGAGWMMRTKPAYAAAIRAAADVGGQALALKESDLAVLAAIAYHQPISRVGLKDLFGMEIGRDLIARLAERGLIGSGPREPRRGSPHTFITTRTFLAAFGLESLRELPEPELLTDAGLDLADRVEQADARGNAVSNAP
jgi:segregation and condensation protein B